MLLIDYIQKSGETAIYPDIGNNIQYPALGLCGEATELLEKTVEHGWSKCADKMQDIIAECGDVMWYHAALIREMGFDNDESIERLGEVSFAPSLAHRPTYIFPHTEGTTSAAVAITIYAGKVAEAAKKIQRDGMSQKLRGKMLYALKGVLWYLSCFLSPLGVPMVKVAEMNIEKLMSRKERNVLQGSGDNR